jgi:hypothetical protein
VHLAGETNVARMQGREIIDRADRSIDPGIRILLGTQRRGM